jgi:DNA (cytosine-5)-methyltransferase 1
MKFGSVCSGIEAASVAWHPLGWKAAWLSEIEPFPSAVLAHHYPDTPNLGDMTELPERILSGEVEAPDVFCGGTPCQAFSVAGLRQSLGDARGNLSLTFCEIANAIDTVRHVRGEQPAIVFWENVPGVLSTSDNAFGCFLAQLCGGSEPLIAPNGWTNAGCVSGPKRTVAWRVLDAQYFGVAQRRRRVFVVASARNDFDPAAVLFEFDGVRRDIAPSRQAREGVAGGIEIGPSGGRLTDLNPTLDTRAKDGPVRNQLAGAVMQSISQVCPTLRAGGNQTGGDRPPGTDVNTADSLIAITQFGETAGTLTARHDSSPCADRGMNVVAQPIAFHPTQDPISSTDGTTHGLGCGSSGGQASVAVAHVVGALACNTGPNGHDAGNFACNQAVDAGHVLPVAQPMPINTMVALRHEALGEATGFGIGEAGDPAYTLTKGHSHAVAQPIGCFKGGQGSAAGGIGYDEHIAPTLSAADSGSNRTPALMHGMAVRRLTPVECERLQGFPDNYTNIPWRKNPESPDGPRYKALGNSWAVPVVRWIGSRINESMK